MTNAKTPTNLTTTTTQTNAQALLADIRETTKKYSSISALPKLFISPLCESYPRMQLTPKFAAQMPTKWVEEFNQWMIEFFGMTEPKIYNVQSPVTGERIIITSSKIARELIESGKYQRISGVFQSFTLPKTYICLDIDPINYPTPPER